MRILICHELCQKYINYAKYLLTLFVKNCEQVYSKSFAVYNIHNLLHIADNAERYGCLDNCSAFKFENYLGKLKTLVHHGNHVLQQICARLEEQFYTCDNINNKVNKLNKTYAYIYYLTILDVLSIMVNIS